MKAVRCLRYGEPSDFDEVLAVEEVEDPLPGEGEVLVDIAAAAVNFPDVLLIAGRYQVRLPVPFVPGSEFAGTVAAVGSGVGTVRPGDRVAGMTMTGAFAERVVVPGAALRPVPDGADLAVAAAGGVALGTAYSTLHAVAAVRPTEWVAVTGAAGGVGSASLLLAREAGARALAVVSSRAKAEFCARLGADAVLDLSAISDVRAAVRDLTGGGVDVLVDLVGGPLAETLLRAMRRGGRFVTVGYASGDIPRIPLNLVLLKGISVHGFDMRQYNELEPAAAARDAAAVTELSARGIAVPVTARFPLVHAREALRAVADRTTTGKVVLVTGH
ncbi:MAG: Alcohol dehydrogenase, zinc-binding domain protein [Rhizobacter sp.]|nr:Alcohol dehydrogenase, zinc-binding domain protein [Rhizobacter sp.]